jgi:hypothetical protein
MDIWPSVSPPNVDHDVSIYASDRQLTPFGIPVRTRSDTSSDMLSFAHYTLLLAFGLSAVRSTPVARDNDGSQPITWISAAGNQRCWQVDTGNVQVNQILVV